MAVALRASHSALALALCTLHLALCTGTFRPFAVPSAPRFPISDSQARIERLTLAVDRERDVPARIESADQKIADLTELLRNLQQTLEQEWKAIRQIHEEPAKQLRDQAAALGEICVSAANLALQGFERAEARFAALEKDLQGQLAQLSRDVQTLVDVRRDPARLPALPPASAPFPLESVMRIHDELRTEGDPTAERRTQNEEPRTADILTARVESLEREVSSERDEVRDSTLKTNRLRRDWRLAVAGLAVALVAATLLGMKLISNVNTRLDDAATRVSAAERQAQAANDAATRQVAAARAEADKQISEARQSAGKAEIVSEVLAAPDLVRYTLVGGAQAGRASAQALWSRAHGLVLSASGLPAATDGGTYQIWIVTPAAQVSAGTFTPNANGDATIAVAVPASVPRPVTGIVVTFEASGEQAAPSGPAVLARATQ